MDKLVRRLPRIGFLVRHKTIWLSELLANIIVGLVLVCLMSITALIVIRERAVRRLDHRITDLRSEKIRSDLSLAQMQRELQILTLLRTLAGDKVADTTLCRVAGLVYRNSEGFGYDPLLLLAVIRVESVYDPLAKGCFASGAVSGAIGLMQLQVETAQEIAQQLHYPAISKQDLLKPDVNLVLGVAYLTRLITQFKSFKLGLLAYNQGPGVVMQTLSSGEPLLLDYYKSVLHRYWELKKAAAKIDEEAAVTVSNSK